MRQPDPIRTAWKNILTNGDEWEFVQEDDHDKARWTDAMHRGDWVEIERITGKPLKMHNDSFDMTDENK